MKFNWQMVVLSLALTAAAGFMAYSNTFNVPFVFDDIHSIVESEARRNPDWSWRTWIGTRSLPSKTLDFNYKFNKLDVTGYHAVNLLIHIVAGWGAFALAYGLAKQSLPGKEWKLAGFTINSWHVMGLLAGLLFVLHPLQTQAVTYIVQRLASMATMFYLWALAGYVFWRQGSGRLSYGWAALSWLATLAAMHSKEIAATIPIAIVFLEFIFFSRRPKQFARRLPQLSPWLLTFLIIPLYLGGLNEIIKGETSLGSKQLAVGYIINKANTSSVETRDISRAVYLLTEFNVLRTYLRLLVWPVGQNLDYDYPLAKSLGEIKTLGSIALIIVVIGSGFWLWRIGWKIGAYGIAIFYIGQLVESSVIPIKDVIFEHRIYFSFIGFALLAGEAAVRILLRWPDKRWRAVWLVMIPIVLVVLGVATWRRNAVWGSELSLWTDVAQKSPHKSRAYNNIGVAYMRQKDFVKAEENYKKELELDPGSVSAHVNLGSIWGQQGKYQEARLYLEKAIALNPSSASAYNNLGNILRETNDLPAAEAAYKKSLAIQSQDADTWYNLGLVYISQQRTADAADALLRAVELRGDEHADWHNKLGALLAIQGKQQPAEEHLREALRIDSQLMPAYGNLGNVLMMRGENKEAMQWYARSLTVRPDDPNVLTSLGEILASMGAREQAREAYQKALRLQPNLERAKRGMEKIENNQ